MLVRCAPQKFKDLVAIVQLGRVQKIGGAAICGSYVFDRCLQGSYNLLQEALLAKQYTGDFGVIFYGVVSKYFGSISKSFGLGRVLDS